jgi:hypothetical protein
MDHEAEPPKSPVTINSNSFGSGHKGSLKSNKLAKRARSFKEDLLEKISQIRTPTNPSIR